ncbi:hypothetical protein SIID45300_00372 [Candidatus Magnetaquicoccaceae bacterium FCR-1]|uniref:Uncharacterized protein n=1 Tax=Candidatus Magnetaquiglobus chichijimensis TaxID=3141448 RepID=A0ABQ0C5D3_9PROT
MNSSFIIHPRWETAYHGSEEIRQTSALLRITVNGRLATRVDNDWSRSVHEEVMLSTYPLAMWLAASWWRLRWETTPDRPTVEWRMAHELSGAGHGYLWPPMRIETDGASVTVHCAPPLRDSGEPIRYLSILHESMPVEDFMRGVSAFIDTVIARLDGLGLRDTGLHRLWRAVAAEWSDPEMAGYRKLEALLGFEPDEGPDAWLEEFKHLEPRIGAGATAEIAAACAGHDAVGRLARVMRCAEQRGVEGGFGNIAAGFGNRWRTLSVFLAQPWEQGRSLARDMRDWLGLDLQPVSDNQLLTILEMPKSAIDEKTAPMHDARLGVAVREGERDRVRFLFQRRSPTGRRFELARWLGDWVWASAHDHWLPSTEAKTARQKSQRAFAAEFLAPIQAVQAFLGDDLTDEERIEEAGDHFAVSPRLIQSSLVNHDLVAHDRFGLAFSFA